MLVPIDRTQFIIVEVHINGWCVYKVHGTWVASTYRPDHYNIVTLEPLQCMPQHLRNSHAAILGSSTLSSLHTTYDSIVEQIQPKFKVTFRGKTQTNEWAVTISFIWMPSAMKLSEETHPWQKNGFRCRFLWSHDYTVRSTFIWLPKEQKRISFGSLQRTWFKITVNLASRPIL